MLLRSIYRLFSGLGILIERSVGATFFFRKHFLLNIKSRQSLIKWFEYDDMIQLINSISLNNTKHTVLFISFSGWNKIKYSMVDDVTYDAP